MFIRKLIKYLFDFTLIVVFISATAYSQSKKDVNNNLLLYNKLKTKVETNLTNLEAHRAYIRYFEINDPKLEAQYILWIKQFPKIYTVPFAIGEAYANQKNPKAIPFLLLANTLKPTNPDVYNLLKGNAYFTNDLVTRQKYIKKAMQYNPTNADFAYDYARSFEDKEPKRSDSLYLDVARRFPNSVSGADALIVLAEHTSICAEKIVYYKQYQLRYPTKQSYQYKDSMSDYFDLLLNNNPESAFEFGLEMVLQDKLFLNFWYERLKVAHQFIQAKKLMIESQPGQALTLLNNITLEDSALNNHIRAEETLALFKAEAAEAANKINLAYNSLILLYSKVPTDRLHEAVFKYGCKLGFDSIDVQKRIFKLRNKSLEQAQVFQLNNFLNGQKINLSDYRGKVVLLSYWFPLCTPCRMEFPHFETVLNKIDRTKVAYLGLNIDPKEDELVLPFLKETGYSFTALRDNWKREKGNLAAPGAPTNYLIDQQGRIVFSNFMINASNEKTLELMINEILAAKDY